ncbi:MAG: hypothetical protein HY958_14070 [Bacteroidia bacterium]|nr:hypothetical protein [Bacteroidia bacterium]
MKHVLYKTFNIQTGEGFSVLLLILQSFFLGIFYGSFDIAASALFLEAYPASMLPKAFVISGVAGLVLTTIYTKLQTKIPFAKLALLNLIAVTLITFLLRIGYFYTGSKWLPFLILVMMGPLNIIALLGFWGVAGRMFSLRQGKRLFGLIDSGQVFGIIVSCYTIPVILLLSFSTKNLLYVCSSSILLALAVQVIISRKFILTDAQKNTTQDQKKNEHFFSFLKNRFIVYMAVFVVLSMISAFFIYYSFLSVTNIKYPDSKDLAKFLGVFTGTLMIFSFIFKTFLYSKIMQTYNLRISLLILPSLLIILSLLAVLIGITFGYTAETAGFILFFLLISLSRLFSRSLKESIEAPSFKILYLSLDPGIRYDIQARIDGVVNEFAALFSGILLAVLGMLSFIQPIHYTYILIVLLIVWIVITLRLYKEYQASLVKSLGDSKKDTSLLGSEKQDQENLIENIGKTEPAEKLICTLYLYEITQPVSFETVLLSLTKHPSSNVRKYVLNKISELHIYKALDLVKEISEQDQDAAVRKLAKDIFQKFSGKLNVHFTREYIAELIKSKYPEDREFAAKIIGILQNEAYYLYLVPLIRDIDFRTRTSAISVCTQIKYTEICPLLIEYLSDPVYSNHAKEALVAFGSEATDILELSFYKSDLDTKIQLKILDIFGLTGDEKSVSFLINKLNFPVRIVVKKAIESLVKCKYKFNESHYIYIRQAIDLTISIIAWNLSALNNIKESEVGTDLKQAVSAEIKENYDILYRLLSLVYDPKMILKAKDNIEIGSPEGVGYALELLDLYISDDLKPALFPLFENTTVIEKIRRLQDFYPLEKQDTLRLLYTIISRDCNLINRWTKACAIYSLRNFKNIKAGNDLLAHLFNSDRLLFETTGYVVHRIDPEAYIACGKRINRKLLNELDYILILATEKKNHILVEKVLFLKSIPLFANVPDMILTEIAEALDEKTVDKDTILVSGGEEKDAFLYMIINGKILHKQENSLISCLSERDIFSEVMIRNTDSISSFFVSAETSCLYYIKRKKMMELLTYYNEIAEVILKTSDS